MTPKTEITTLPPRAEIVYPTSDGRPMGETDLHRNIMFESIESLKLHYAGQSVYVSGSILLFYQPGNRRRHVSPDVLVVKGVDSHDRENYLLWKEGRPPHVVIEVTSESTRDEDLDDKFEIYRDQIRVAEYFLFDPRSEYLQPTLQGYRLRARRYEPIKPVSGRLPSRELGLQLQEHERRLRFFDPSAGHWIPTPEEARKAAEAQCKQIAEKCQQAEAQAERLRRELETLRRRLKS